MYFDPFPLAFSLPLPVLSRIKNSSPYPGNFHHGTRYRTTAEYFQSTKERAYQDAKSTGDHVTGFDAAILGIVEGLTEFLPVSSTGHLILASEILHLPQTEAHKVFEVAIQLGAILAVACLYWRKLIARSDLLLKLAVGFLPTGIIGLTLYKLVKNLFDASVVSVSLIVGGFAFFVMEYYLKNHKPAIMTPATLPTAPRSPSDWCSAYPWSPAYPAPAQPSSADCCAA
jgi:hypothetical protein